MKNFIVGSCIVLGLLLIYELGFGDTSKEIKKWYSHITLNAANKQADKLMETIPSTDEVLDIKSEPIEEDIEKPHEFKGDSTCWYIWYTDDEQNEYSMVSNQPTQYFNSDLVRKAAGKKIFITDFRMITRVSALGKNDYPSNQQPSYWFVVAESQTKSMMYSAYIKLMHKCFAPTQAALEFKEDVFIKNFIEVSKETYEHNK